MKVSCMLRVFFFGSYLNGRLKCLLNRVVILVFGQIGVNHLEKIHRTQDLSEFSDELLQLLNRRLCSGGGNLFDIFSGLFDLIIHFLLEYIKDLIYLR